MARVLITFLSYECREDLLKDVTYFSIYIMILFVFKKGKETKDSDTCFDKHLLIERHYWL